MRCEPVVSKRFTLATAWPGADGTISGRNWEVWVGVTGQPHPESGMILSLSDLKVAMQRVLDQVDHWHLTETPIWKNQPDMSAWLQWWWEASQQALAGYSCQLHHVYVSSAYEGGWVTAQSLRSFRWATRHGDTPLGRFPLRIRYPADTPLPEALAMRSPTEWPLYLSQVLPWGQLLMGDRVYEWHEGNVYAEVWQEWAGPHRLYRADWSKEQNESFFGVCTRLHGHTFRVGLTVPLSEVSTIPPGVLASYDAALRSGELTIEAWVTRLMRDHVQVVRWRLQETERNRVSCRRAVLGPAVCRDS